MSSQVLYWRAYDLEQGAGQPARAVVLYEQAALAAGTNSILAARATLRSAICFRKMGAWQQAARYLEKIPSNPALDPDWLRRVKAEDQLLHQRREWVRVHGTVIGSDGSPASDAILFAGNWGLDAPVIVASNGNFTLDCKAAGDELFGFPHILLYVEARTQACARIQMVRVDSNGMAEAEVRLASTMAIQGTVVDAGGRPVADAQVGLTAFLVGEFPAYVPLDRILPPVTTGPDGGFMVPAVPQGLRLRLTIRKEGYTPREMSGELLVDMAAGRAGRIGLSPMILDPLGSAAITGMVMDEDGQPLVAKITVSTMPPALRELVVVRTDDDGRYHVNAVAAARVVLRVEATGYAWRGVTGLPVDPPVRADFVLSGTAPVARSAVQGTPAPEVTIQAINAPPLTLAGARGDVVVLVGWDRSATSAPPRILNEWHHRFAARGLRIWCVADHTGHPAELAALIVQEGLPYAVAIDSYAPAAPPLAHNSLTRARYALGDGDAALIDAAGKLIGIGSLHDSREVLRMETVLGGLLRKAVLAEPVLRDAGTNGPAAPTLRVARWVRGEAWTAGAGNPAESQGRYTVLHFGSAYREARLRENTAGRATPLEQVLRLQDPAEVNLVWILPAAEKDVALDPLAPLLRRDSSVAVDEEDRTRIAFGVGTEPCNVVVDRTGRIVVPGCTDSQLFRVLKGLFQQH